MILRTIRTLPAAAVLAAVTLACAVPAAANVQPAVSEPALKTQQTISRRDKYSSGGDDRQGSEPVSRSQQTISRRDKFGSGGDDRQGSGPVSKTQQTLSPRDKFGSGEDDKAGSGPASKTQQTLSPRDKFGSGEDDKAGSGPASKAQQTLSPRDKFGSVGDDRLGSGPVSKGGQTVSAQDKRDMEADISAQSRQGSGTEASPQETDGQSTLPPAQEGSAAAFSETESEMPAQMTSEGGQQLIAAWYASMRSEGENFIFSPYSLLDCVRILYPAADGESRSQIEEVLGLDDARAAALQALDEGMLFENGIGAKSANKAYINTGLPDADQLHPEILDTEDVDLSPFDDQTFARINEEIAERTEQKIQGLLSPENVTADTASVLLNCLYFMNTWDHTECEVSWRGEKDVPGFSDTVSLFQIKEEGDLDILRLPYSNAPLEEDEWGTCLGLPVEGMDRYSLYVICDRDDSPEEKVDEFMKTLTFADLTRLLDFSDYESLSGYTDAFFKVPEFEVRSRSSLTSLLKSLGMTAPFQPGTTDFQRFGPFWISDILQEAYMKTTHSGTEAAAVTAMVMEAAAAPVETVQVWKNVVADSPFAVILKDDTANEILFIGRIGEPA